MVYDQAYQLARSIQDSSEFTQYREAMNKISGDPSAKQMLDDFRKRQMDLQTKQFSGESVSQEEWDNFSKVYEVVQLHKDISHMLEAERRLGLMMDDIQKIISEPLKSLLSEE